MTTPNTIPAELDLKALLNAFDKAARAWGAAKEDDIRFAVKTDYLTTRAALERALPRASGVPEAEAVAWQPHAYREQAKKLNDKLMRDGMLRVGSPVDTILAFAESVWMEGFSEGCREPLPVAALEASPVAWQWRPKGSKYWISDPNQDWLDRQGDAVEKRALYAGPPKAAMPSGIYKAWLHTLHMELGQTNESLTFSAESPFGIRGKDYSQSYEVMSDPLYLAPPVAAPSGKAANEAYERGVRFGRKYARDNFPIASEPKDAGSGEGQKAYPFSDEPHILILEGDMGVCVGGRFHGWRMWRHPDGQWVSMKKLEAVVPEVEPALRPWRPAALQELNLSAQETAILSATSAMLGGSLAIEALSNLHKAGYQIGLTITRTAQSRQVK